MYYFTLFVIIAICFIEYRYERVQKYSFFVSLFLIAFLLCFRCGVGIDYDGYYSNYYDIDNHSEWGFYLLERTFLFLHIDYRLFVFLISSFMMFCSYRAISLFCKYSSLSLLISFHTIVLTYYFSGMRQGIVIAFFLGFMLKWLKEDNWIKYVIGCIAMMLLHTVSIVLIILPIAKRIPQKVYKILVPLSFLSGGILMILGRYIIGHIYLGSMSWYEFAKNISPSWLGILERICMFGLIFWLWCHSGEHTEDEKLLFTVYTVGFMISMVFMPWSMLCSRVPAALKATEILLIPLLLNKQSKYKLIIFIMICLYVFVMTTKNLEGYSYEVSAWGYPWYFILSKKGEEYPYLGMPEFIKSFKDILLRHDYEIAQSLEH